MLELKIFFCKLLSFLQKSSGFSISSLIFYSFEVILDERLQIHKSINYVKQR
jgi:hypothetical protein